MKKQREFDFEQFIEDLKMFTIEDLHLHWLEAKTGVWQPTKMLTPKMLETLDSVMRELNELYPDRIKGILFSEPDPE